MMGPMLHMTGLIVRMIGPHAACHAACDGADCRMCRVRLADDQIVTSNLNVHFVHPLRAGLLEVRAHVVHSMNRMMTVYGSVTGEDGRLGTIGTGSFRVKGELTS
ncbi:hotdog domain-containing protein [Paenibacillus thiaminolyticus]|uniref:hotdog domain-containing protein n=1 Tax=Paenibacillus thiaminolyticus TaxID=49283 RepID=UPI003D270C53